MVKNLHKLHHQLLSRHKNQGFTLIELLVASALSIIIIMAVGGGYLKTRELSMVMQQRVGVQQDLRLVSSLMSQAIRNAGNYGCYSYSDAQANPLKLSKTFLNKYSGSESVFMKNQDSNATQEFYNVRILASNQLPKSVTDAFTIDGQALAIQGSLPMDYEPNASAGSVSKFSSIRPSNNLLQNRLVYGEFVVVADCSRAVVGSNYAGGGELNTISSRKLDEPWDCAGEKCFNEDLLKVKPYQESLFFMGESRRTGRKGLFRLLLSMNKGGNMGFNVDKPELLLDSSDYDVASMVSTLHYLDSDAGSQGCLVENVTDVDGNNLITQRPAFTQEKTGNVRTPVLVDVDITLTKANQADIVYPFTAGIRGANTCANSIQKNGN